MLARVDVSVSRRALGAVRGWRALGADRQLACAAALGLFATLFAPWYSETVTARGVSGTMAMRATMSGWQALSGVGIIVLLVAVGAPTWLLVRAAHWRNVGRAHWLRAARVDGAVLQLVGLVCVVLTAIAMIDHAGTAHDALTRTSSGIGWGLVLTLVCAIALMALGVRARAVTDAVGDWAHGAGGGGVADGGGVVAGDGVAADDRAQAQADVEAWRAERLRARARARQRRADDDLGAGHVRPRTHVEPLGLDHRD